MPLFLIAVISATRDDAEFFDITILNNRVIEPGSGIDAVRILGLTGGRMIITTVKYCGQWSE